MNKAKALLAVLLFLLLTVAVFQHFHDDPPPDLSRYTRPEHDPAAYAKAKALCETFERQFRNYSSKEPGNPYDRKGILNGDANAVRALRQHLKDNEDALATAHDFVALKTFAYPPANAKELFFGKLIRLLQREALLAAHEGRPEDAFAILAECFEWAQVRDKATDSIFRAQVAFLDERTLFETAEALVARETDPKRLRTFLSRLERAQPEPLALFRQSVSGDLLHNADLIMPSRGGRMEKPPHPTPTTPTQTLREKAEEHMGNIRQDWLWVNTLPNAAIALYARVVDEELADPSPNRPAKPPVNDPFRLLRRNVGGLGWEDNASPWLSRYRTNCFQTRLRHDRLRIATALRIHALEHEGRRPATLGELAPGILSEVPVNILDGKPFYYDPTTGGF